MKVSKFEPVGFFLRLKNRDIIASHVINCIASFAIIELKSNEQ